MLFRSDTSGLKLRPMVWNISGASARLSKGVAVELALRSPGPPVLSLQGSPETPFPLKEAGWGCGPARTGSCCVTLGWGWSSQPGRRHTGPGCGPQRPACQEPPAPVAVHGQPSPRVHAHCRAAASPRRGLGRCGGQRALRLLFSEAALQGRGRNGGPRRPGPCPSASPPQVLQRDRKSVV